MNMQISAIICTHNRARYLSKAIHSLVDQTLDKTFYEILIVDNASSDDTKHVVLEEFSDISNLRYIHEPILGLSQARNTGCKNAKGRYIAFMDDDAVADKDWLISIVKCFEQVKPMPDIIGGEIKLRYETKNKPKYIDETIEIYYGKLEYKDRGFLAAGSKLIHYLNGVNFAVREKMLNKIEPFNVGLGRKGRSLISCEESDFLERAAKNGCAIYYEPEMRVTHSVLKERLSRRYIICRFFSEGLSRTFMRYQKEGSSIHKSAFIKQKMKSIFTDLKSLINGSGGWFNILLQICMKTGEVCGLFLCKKQICLKIAFFSCGSKAWYAGIVQFKDIFYALNDSYNGFVKFYFVTSAHHSVILRELKQLTEASMSIPVFRKWSPLGIVNSITKRLFPHNALYTVSCLKRHHIDVIFGLALPCRYDKIPSLSWICDFQHVHFPEMFSREERLDRDRKFYRTASISSRIIVMSQSVKDDFKKLLPQFLDKVRVLSTVTYIPELVYKTDPKQILSLYSLPEKFIYLPNQFWKHKNHEIAFKAVKILKDKGTRVNLVCTGFSKDYRNPTYFTDLLEKLTDWDIKGQVIYLGVIPYEHVLLLMRQSVCVLNPSLFEGFGLTANEAKSLGKQVLLSDIAPFREQNPPKATFFDPKNAEDLAKNMANIWQKTPPGPDLDLEEVARKELPQQIQKSAYSFMSVIKEVIRQ